MVATPALLGPNLGTLFIKKLLEEYGDRCINNVEPNGTTDNKDVFAFASMFFAQVLKKQSKDNKLQMSSDKRTTNIVQKRESQPICPAFK